MKIQSSYSKLLSLLLVLLASTSLLAQSRPAAETRGQAGAEATNESVITDWLKQYAIPIKSVEADNDFADLQPLKAVLADARVVGLGEATHGTREFFQFKHRMLKFLVREMDFKVFAIEASYATCLQVNDYVQGDKVSRAEALQSLGFSVWQTEEMAALIDWLRTYNQTVAPERRVKFYGYDMQDMGGAWEVMKYLQQVAPDKVTEVNETLTKLGKAVQSSFNGSKDDLKALRPEVDKLLSYFVLQEAKFVYKTSRSKYEENLHRLRLLAQSVDVFSQEWNDTRDRYMADNIVYLLNRESAGTRMVVWAHNSHISTGEINYLPSGGKAMGAYLRQILGTGYYALGLIFNEGSFQTTSNPSGGNLQYLEYTVGPAGAGSLNWYFAQPQIGNYIIDLRHTPKSEVVQQWLKTPRGLGWVGGYNVPPDFKEQWAAGNFLKSTLSKEYDGLVFIERTTRARPLKNEALKQN